jgi:hypothetical protein
MSEEWAKYAARIYGGSMHHLSFIQASNIEHLHSIFGHPGIEQGYAAQHCTQTFKLKNQHPATSLNCRFYFSNV